MIVTFVFGSVGWTIDKFKPKKLISFLLIIFYIVVLLILVFNNVNQIRCLGCGLIMHRNILTKECKCFCVGCGNHAPWYWEEDDSCEKTGICGMS